MLVWHDTVCALLGEPVPRFGPSVSPADHAEKGKIDQSTARPRTWKSPGQGTVIGEMCEDIWETIPSHIQCLYKWCIQEGNFPAF